MKNRVLFVFTILAMSFYLTLPSCYYDVEEELYPFQFCDTTSTSSYSQSIVPILQQNCIGCHGGSDPTASIGLDDYLGVKSTADSGALSCSINHGSGCSPMPDNAPKLNACEIFKVDQWIENGAQND